MMRTNGILTRGNGVVLPHNQQLKLIVQQRIAIRNVYVIDKKIVAAPADEKGLTGQGMHTATIAG